MVAVGLYNVFKNENYTFSPLTELSYGAHSICYWGISQIPTMAKWNNCSKAHGM